MPNKRGDDTDGGGTKPARKRNSVGSVDDAEFKGYINLNLSSSQKEQYPLWSASQSYWEALESFTADGVNISLKRNRKQGGFLASGTQRASDSPNAGLCVTARAADASTALGRLLFSLTVLSTHERWEEVQPVADADRW